MPKMKHIRLSFEEGSEVDKEIEEVKKHLGIESNVELVRLALHYYLNAKMGRLRRK